MEILSVCLSDIPKEKMKKADNGKIYVNLVVSRRKEKDNYGNDLSVSVSKTKEERESGAETVYCGNGQTKDFTPQSVEAVENLPTSVGWDLPWE